MRLWDFADFGSEVTSSASAVGASLRMDSVGAPDTSKKKSNSTNQTNASGSPQEAASCRSYNTRNFYPSGISWHPTHKQRLLAVSIEGVRQVCEFFFLSQREFFSPFLR